MIKEKDPFDYWNELYRSLGITIYLRKPHAPDVFETNSVSLRDAGVYEVKGLRMKLLAARRDMSEILFQLSDREGRNMYGKAEKGLTLDKLIFESAYYLEAQSDLRVLGIYGANASVEIPNHAVSPVVLSWRRVRGNDGQFKIIHLFPKHLKETVKIGKTFEKLELACQQ